MSSENDVTLTRKIVNGRPGRDKTIAVVSVLVIIVFVWFCSTSGNRDKSPRNDSKSMISHIEESKGSTNETIQGRGDNIEKVYLYSGLAEFSFTNSGSANFIVWLINMDGDKLSLLVNDVGSYSGSKTAKIPSAGTYILEVKSDGNYVIKIKQ